MPWQAASVMSIRQEFLEMIQTSSVSFSELCRRFQISRKTGYKWTKRFEQGGVEDLKDRSRRPNTCSHQLKSPEEEMILQWRRRYPTWGARKIRKRLEFFEPACSTITAVLRRHNMIQPRRPDGGRDWIRFEHAAPNDLWQMDFKGRVGLIHPLTVLDDHSRFNICLKALPNERTQTVHTALEASFRCYGLPYRMTMDNGSPWGSCDSEHGHTPLTVWLIRLGVSVSHSRPYHPQTQGKDERFHRTLKADVLIRENWRDRDHLQSIFDQYRHDYNFERPHDALSLEVPASRYQCSPRSFPDVLPTLEYDSTCQVRRVQQEGKISFKNRAIKVGRAFIGQPVGIRPTTEDGVFDVLYSHQVIHKIDLRLN
jgi:transposase InsO family protein